MEQVRAPYVAAGTPLSILHKHVRADRIGLSHLVGGLRGRKLHQSGSGNRLRARGRTTHTSWLDGGQPGNFLMMEGVGEEMKPRPWEQLLRWPEGAWKPGLGNVSDLQEGEYLPAGGAETGPLQ